jgi:hypothetical protein
MTARGAVPALGLALFILLLAVERISELFLSRYNMRLLRERGAEEYGRAHYPWFVALHVLFPLALGRGSSGDSGWACSSSRRDCASP